MDDRMPDPMDLLRRLYDIQRRLKELSAQVVPNEQAERLCAPLAGALQWRSRIGFCSTCNQKGDARRGGRWFCQTCGVSWTPVRSNDDDFEPV